MSDKSRVVWSEGLFLRPQHLQQQDRYYERYVEERAGSLRSHAWGLTELEFERELLGVGKLAVRRACGVFPDGTPFAMPEHDPLPPAMDIGVEVRNRTVYLALPIRRAGSVEMLRSAPAESLARYTIAEIECHDSSLETSSTVPVETAALRPRLLLDGMPLDDFSCIPIAQIAECTADRRVVLDSGFMPSALTVRACPPLDSFGNELVGMLNQTGESLARAVGGLVRGAMADYGDALRLVGINRFEPLCRHLAQSPVVHPEDLYRVLLMLAGDLATVSSPTRRLRLDPEYRHHDLRSTFKPLMETLRTYLMTSVSRYLAIEVKQMDQYNYAAAIEDRSLYQSAQFVLAIGARMPETEIRERAPKLIKVAAPARIREVVLAHLPGIALRPLANLPPQLPVYSGWAYFEFDRGSDDWAALAQAPGMQFYVQFEFPELKFELYAIRGERPQPLPPGR